MDENVDDEEDKNDENEGKEQEQKGGKDKEKEGDEEETDYEEEQKNEEEEKTEDKHEEKDVEEKDDDEGEDIQKEQEADVNKVDDQDEKQKDNNENNEKEKEKEKNNEQKKEKNQEKDQEKEHNKQGEDDEDDDDDEEWDGETTPVNSKTRGKLPTQTEESPSSSSSNQPNVGPSRSNEQGGIATLIRPSIFPHHREHGRAIVASITQSPGQFLTNLSLDEEEDEDMKDNEDSFENTADQDLQTPQIKPTITREELLESASPVKMKLEYNPVLVLEDAPKPFNRSYFIFEKKDESDVNKLVKDSFNVITTELSIEEFLNMLCFMKGEIFVPKVNHHFVTNNEYRAMKNAFELEIKNVTTLLNNKLYVGCFKVTSGSGVHHTDDLVPLYTIQGKPVDKFFGQFVSDTNEVKNMIENIKQKRFTPIENWSKAQNIQEMKSIHVAPADGNHRTKCFHQFAKEAETAYLLGLDYKLQVNFLLPKHPSKPSLQILQDYDDMSDHVMKITKKGKEHSIWDALQTIFNLMEKTLETVSDCVLQTLYTARMVTVTVHDSKLKKDVDKEVPAFLYCKEPSSIYKAFTDIFDQIIKALLRNEDLKAEWMSYYDVDEDHLLEPLARLHCHDILNRFTTFMGTETYTKFKNATHLHSVKLKVQNIDLPFQFIQIFHVILTAAMSKSHFKSIKS